MMEIVEEEVLEAHVHLGSIRTEMVNDEISTRIDERLEENEANLVQIDVNIAAIEDLEIVDEVVVVEEVELTALTVLATIKINRTLQCSRTLSSSKTRITSFFAC